FLFIISILFFILYFISKRNNKELFNKQNKIDVVYTWVDSKDKKWLMLKKIFSKKIKNKPEESNNKLRFNNIDELKYSLRSLYKFSPWVNNIFIVVHDGQYPKWLNKNESKIKIIEHSQIFDDLNNLPTFNSQAIECNIDNIPNLSEYFLYFNDDMFLGKELKYDYLFHKNSGKPKFFLDEYAGTPFFFKRKPITGYEFAWKNINNLLKNRFNIENEKGVSPIHQCRLYKKSYIKEVKKIFKKYFKITSKSRFRSTKDISPLGLVSMYTLYRKYYIPSIIRST
ncbi:unnamed protein product, partial [marine sediment metagenome]